MTAAYFLLQVYVSHDIDVVIFMYECKISLLRCNQRNVVDFSGIFQKLLVSKESLVHVFHNLMQPSG